MSDDIKYPDGFVDSQIVELKDDGLPERPTSWTADHCALEDGDVVRFVSDRCNTGDIAFDADGYITVDLER